MASPPLCRSPPAAVLELVRDLAETHDPSVSLDTVRAYHFGPRFLVELELVMDEHTPLRESHDCGILLQHKIEALPSVERCFVHIDYQHVRRDPPTTSPPTLNPKPNPTSMCGAIVPPPVQRA